MKKGIIKAIREKVITFSLIAAMMIGIMPASAFAAEKGTIPEPTVFGSNFSAITPRASEETWHYGYHNMDPLSFSFTNNNTTPLKTIEGNYVQIYGYFQKAPGDAGLGSIALSVGIKDENGNFIAGPWKILPIGDGSEYTPFLTPQWDFINQV